MIEEIKCPFKYQSLQIIQLLYPCLSFWNRQLDESKKRKIWQNMFLFNQQLLYRVAKNKISVVNDLNRFFVFVF